MHEHGPLWPFSGRAESTVDNDAEDAPLDTDDAVSLPSHERDDEMPEYEEVAAVVVRRQIGLRNGEA